MTMQPLEKFFAPRSVAIIGASDTPGRVGYAVIRNLVAGGYRGTVYPVNSGKQTINGLHAYPSLAAIGETIDLAVIATPLEAARGVIEACGLSGVDSAIVLAAGGKETGAGGAQLEGAILEAARQGGVRIIGPNCVGVISTAANLNTSFLDRMPPTGNIAFISQSGAMCLAILDRAAREHIGFRHFISIGSMLDVDFGDLLNYCCGDSGCRSIVLYVENITQARKFMSAARAASRVKPIIVLKAGRSQAGAKAAFSHTGAMAGADDVYCAAFARAGITQVDTIEELFDCTELLAKQPFPTGPRLAVITNGGGPGVVAMDAIDRLGLIPAQLSGETMDRLDAVLPPFWSHGNPIDIIGDASPARWRQAVEICAADPGIDGLIIIFIPQALSNAVAVSNAIIDYLKQKPKFPVFPVWMGGTTVDQAVYQFNLQGYPTYSTPERAVAAFQRLDGHRRRQKMLQEIPGRFSSELTVDRPRVRGFVDRLMDAGTFVLGELEAKPILAAYGIPINPVKLARTPAEAVRLADQIGYPVVLKIVSPDIVHKSEAGGVCLSLESAAAVEAAYARLVGTAAHAAITGVSVQPMLHGAGYELIIGARRDPVFGPVVIFGAGGIYTEILRDRTIALPPLNRALARQMIEGTRLAPLLEGYRGQAAVSLEVIEEGFDPCQPARDGFSRNRRTRHQPGHGRGRPPPGGGRPYPPRCLLRDGPRPSGHQSLPPPTGRARRHPKRSPPADPPDQTGGCPTVRGTVPETLIGEHLLSVFQPPETHLPGNAGPLHATRLRPGHGPRGHGGSPPGGGNAGGRPPDSRIRPEQSGRVFHHGGRCPARAGHRRRLTGQAHRRRPHAGDPNRRGLCARRQHPHAAIGAQNRLPPAP